MARYDTGDYKKPKRPKSWGSLCPDDLPEDPQFLLDTAALVGRSKYNVSGSYAVCAEEHRPGCWHGYPIPWSRLPPVAKDALIARGRLDEKTYAKALRKGWGDEFR